jgi:hypothetical protein
MQIENIPEATRLACTDAANLLVHHWGFTIEDAFIFLCKLVFKVYASTPFSKSHLFYPQLPLSPSLLSQRCAVILVFASPATLTKARLLRGCAFQSCLRARRLLTPHSLMQRLNPEATKAAMNSNLNRHWRNKKKHLMQV